LKTILAIAKNSAYPSDMIINLKTRLIFRKQNQKQEKTVPCKKWVIPTHFSPLIRRATNLFNPLPVQFTALLHGQQGCVFFSGHLNLRTTPETGLPSRKKIITIKLKKTKR